MCVSPLNLLLEHLRLQANIYQGHNRFVMSIIQSHATAKSSKTAIILDTFFPMFHRLITTLNEKEWPDDLSQDPTVSLGSAKFWQSWHAIQWPKPTS